MDSTAAKFTKWSDRLAMDIALALERSGEPLDEVLLRHEISIQHLAAFNKDPLFLTRVAFLRDEVRTKGLTFRLKARAQAEELLNTSWELIHSHDVSSAVKADLIKSTVKWAGLEPTPASGVGGEANTGVSITINLGDGAAPAAPFKVVEHVG